MINLPNRCQRLIGRSEGHTVRLKGASGESEGLRRYDKENLLWQSTVAIRSDPVGSRYDLPMEQPFFPVRCVDVKTTVKPGRTMVFVGGGLSQKESGNKTLLVFVTVNGVSADIQ